MTSIKTNSNQNETTKIFVHKTKTSYLMQTAIFVVLLYWSIWLNLVVFGTVGVGLLAGIFFISTKGIEIDFENKRYRQGRIAGNICTGQWKPLPKIKYISVFSVSMASKVRGVSNASVSSKNRIIKVNLIHDKNGRLTVFKTKEKDDAFKTACLIAEKMNLKILDATNINRKIYNSAEEYLQLEKNNGHILK